MQALEMKGAATQRYAGSDPKSERLGGVLNQENNKHLCDWQTIGDVTSDIVEHLRIARLRRQFGFDAAQASLIAGLAFSTTGRRY